MSYLVNMFNSNAQAPSMYSAKNISVVKLIVQSAGTYNDQYRRPLNSHADGMILNQLEEVMDRGGSLSALSLAPAAFALLKPSATPEGMMPIENGWGARRFRFLLHIAVEDNMGIRTNHHYSGFTAYCDSSFSGQLDPNMVFTINSVSSTKSITQKTPTGVHVLQAPVSNNQILTPAINYTGVMSGSKTYSLRPESVVDDIMVADLRAVNDDFHNTVNTISSPTPSSRTNNAAPGYMASLLSGYRNTLIGSGGAESDDNNFEHLKHLVESGPYSQDRFLAWLMNRRVQNPVMGIGHNQFTITELTMLDPSTPSKVRAADTLGIANNFHNAGSTSDWGQSTAEVQFATVVAQTLPTYLTALNISKIAFTALNLTLDGQIQIIISDVQGTNQGADMTPYLQVLIQRLQTELFTSLSYGNTMAFTTEVKCDMIGETWISISLNQGRVEDFVTPTFCDSLLAPMATCTYRNLSNLSNDFKSIFDMIGHKTNDFTTGGSPLYSPAPVQQAASPNFNTGSMFNNPTTTPALAPVNIKPVSLFGNNNPGF